MENLSFSEENYIKAIYHLSNGGEDKVSTNALAESLNTAAASVSDMIKRLAGKKLVSYKKYWGVNISEQGKSAALRVIRKHRLWEVFLTSKLKFNWDEVHEVAEQLEHIKSPLLVKRLDEFLGYPKFDPHGDPIPKENGEFKLKPHVPLSQAESGQSGIIVSVNDTSSVFLKYLDKIGAHIGAKVKVQDKSEFDGSLEISIDNKSVFVSSKASENILIAN